MRPRLAAAFFLASGFSALVYQVAWARAAGLVIGNTTAAVGTVVAVFMGGLALGSALAGRFAARRARAAPAPGPGPSTTADFLRLYGALEIAIGLLGALVPALLSALGPVFAALYPWPAAFAVARVLLVALVLLPPTTLMGATLPLLVQDLTRGDRDAARAAGLLYAVNSLGAALGAFAAGFALIPAMGLRLATLTAVAINVAIGVAAVALGRPAAGTPPPPPPPPAPLPPGARLAVAAYAASGFCALVYEIAWTRALTLAIGSTVYAFTLILGAFIGGLALGSALAARFASRLTRPLIAVAAVQLAIGAWAVFLHAFLARLPATMGDVVARWSDSFAALHAVEFAIVLACVALPCTLMGALLPLTMRATAAGTADAGHAAGRVYAWNTLLCIAGSLLASFLLVPHLGLDWTLRLAAAANLAVAAAVSRQPALALPSLAVLIAAFLMPAWDARTTASGAYLYGRDADKSTVVSSYWDAYGLVTIHRTGDVLSLRINGKTDASTIHADMCTQALTGAIPMVLHPDPKDVLVVGLGSGVTLGQVLRYPVASLDCVEISPAVAKGARHFDHVNGRALDDPRCRLLINDGRAHVRNTPRRYDVVISEPSNLWISGMSVLFTREYFQEVRARLKPGGLFAQWVQVYKLAPDDVRGVVRTLREVFPEVWLWETHPGASWLLTAFPDARRPTGVADRARRALGPELAALGLRTPADLLATFALDSDGTRAFADGARVVTDDDCWLEYTAPKSIYRDRRAETVALVEPHRRSLAPLIGELGDALDRAARSRALLVRGLAVLPPIERARALDEALREWPDDGLTRHYVEQCGDKGLSEGRRLRDAGLFDDALVPLLQWIPRSASRRPEALAVAGHVQLKRKRIVEAEVLFAEARSHAGLALVRLAQGRIEDARSELDCADPAQADTHYARAMLLRQSGDRAGALAAVARALALDPRHADALALKVVLDRTR